MSQPTPRARALPPYAAAALVFGSSAAVLVLEITSLRLIAPYVGITLETNTAVIGFALAAIALGAWAGGRVADIRNPRALIGPLLLAGGALVLLITPTVRFVAEGVGPSAAASVALLLAAVTVFAPAALLSAVPPMVVKLQLASLSETGTVVGRLSGISTLGAIVATFLTGFVLVVLIPTSVILLSTGGLLALGGIAMMLVSRGSGTGRRRGMAPSRTAGLLCLVLLAAGLSILAPQSCDTETRYHCASVNTDPDRDSGRLLILDTLRHSYVDLDDPTHLEFAYTRAIAAALDVQAAPGAPLSAVHIGGGGMTLPRYLLETRPGGVNRVVELDPGVVAVDRQRLALPDAEGLQVTVGDGRVSLAVTRSHSADVVIGDAFGGVAVPWHLTTREAVTDVHRILVADGLYALNVIDHAPLAFARAEIATVAAVFEHVLVISPTGGLIGDRGGNIVVLASDQPIDRDAISAGLLQRAAPMSVVSDVELADFLGSDPLILTDDFAPVDQLLTPFG
ncbi:MAG: fused MFS/spermidine synthase [Actinomycetota bacterium]|nr:fused MFS/spermidine synthase [Actinomycetota bacterium]